MTNFVTSVSETIGQHLPGIVGALVVFIISYLIALALGAATRRLVNASKLDGWLKKKFPSQVDFGKPCGQIVFYLILLYGILVALNLVGVGHVLDPAKDMLSRVINVLPDILAAAFIAIGGYIIARIIASVVTALSSTLDGFGPKIGLGEEFKLSKLLGIIVFVSIFVPTLIAALNALGVEAISAPAVTMLQALLLAIPKIIGAAIILGVAYLVGRFVCTILSDLLKSLGADELPAKIGAGGLLGNTSLSVVVGRVVLFFIMLGAALSALEMLELNHLAGALTGLLTFAANVVVGLVIISIGTALANFAGRRLQKDGKSTFGSAIVRIAIMGFVIAMGLRAMQIGDDIVNLAFALTLGAVAVAVALSFGLGGREAAGKQMDHWLTKWRGPKE